MQIVKDPHPLYEIPKGKIGNRFLQIQTDLWKGVRKCKWNSEKALIFDPCMLTKESGVKYAADIWKLITIRLNIWEEDKICSLLSSRNEKGSNVYHLDLELGKGSLNLVPKVLECVNNYSRRYTQEMDSDVGEVPPNFYSREDGDMELVRPFSIMYEILRCWKIPELYEKNRMTI